MAHAKSAIKLLFWLVLVALGWKEKGTSYVRLIAHVSAESKVVTRILGAIFLVLLQSVIKEFPHFTGLPYGAGLDLFKIQEDRVVGEMGVF